MVFYPKPTLTIRGPQGAGVGGGVPQISSDRDDQMGQKSKLPKNCWTKT